MELKSIYSLTVTLKIRSSVAWEYKKKNNGINRPNNRTNLRTMGVHNKGPTKRLFNEDIETAFHYTRASPICGLNVYYLVFTSYTNTNMSLILLCVCCIKILSFRHWSGSTWNLQLKNLKTSEAAFKVEQCLKNYYIPASVLDTSSSVFSLTYATFPDEVLKDYVQQKYFKNANKSTPATPANCSTQKPASPQPWLDTRRRNWSTTHSWLFLSREVKCI